jgi:hypothetical protein
MVTFVFNVSTGMKLKDLTRDKGLQPGKLVWSSDKPMTRIGFQQSKTIQRNKVASHIDDSPPCAEHLRSQLANYEICDARQ